MTQPKPAAAHHDEKKRPPGKQPGADDAQRHGTPKPESSSEYEGAANRKPTGNPTTEVKTETSSSSGQ